MVNKFCNINKFAHKKCSDTNKSIATEHHSDNYELYLIIINNASKHTSFLLTFSSTSPLFPSLITNPHVDEHR